MLPRSALSVVLAVVVPAVVVPVALRAQQPGVRDSADTIVARRSTTAITILDARRLAVPVPSPLALLDGKVAGVRVVALSGEPGTPPAVVIRNAGAGFDSDPLVEIDGVVSRLSTADLNAEDVERIEVLRGPAAAALYGSDAASGVVRIVTRRGRMLGADVTRLDLRSTVGSDALPAPLSLGAHHYFQMNVDSSDYARSGTGGRIVEPDLVADQPYPVYRDPQGRMLRTGNAFTNYAAFAQQFAGTAFNVSLHNDRDEGIVSLVDGYSRQTGRLNVDQQLGSRLTVAFDGFASHSTNDAGSQDGNIYTLRQLDPTAHLDSVTSNCPPVLTSCYVQSFFVTFANIVNPLYSNQVVSVAAPRQRVNAAVRSRYQVLDWLSADGVAAIETLDANVRRRSPTPTAPTWTLFSASESRRVTHTGLALAARHGFLADRFAAGARIAYGQERQTFDESESLTTSPATPGVSPTTRNMTLNTDDVLIETSLAWADRLTFEGGLRRDARSIYSATVPHSWYSRVGAAWRVTRDVRLPGVTELRARVANGTAAAPIDRATLLESFHVVTPGDTKSGDFLRPPFSRETEYGVDATLRLPVSISYTYSQRRDVDELAPVPVGLSTGYAYVWENAMSARSSAHELSVEATLLDRPNYGWRLGVTGDRLRARISANGAPYQLGAFAASFRVADGEPSGQLWGHRWIRTQQQLEETIESGQLPGNAADYVLNEEGYYVRASEYHTIDESPLRAARCDARDAGGACTSTAVMEPIGNTTPDFETGVNTSARWKAFSLGGTLTWVKGGSIYNGVRQATFLSMRDPVMDQSAKPAPPTGCPNLGTPPACRYSTGRKPVSYYARFYDSYNPNEYFVEHASYVSLRELALEWALPQRWLSRLPLTQSRGAQLGIVGRNLWTFSDYRGYGPVVSSGAANSFSYRVDGPAYPELRTVSASLRFDF